MRSDAETPTTELTDAERRQLQDVRYCTLNDLYVTVERILAARAKPAPSGDEREALRIVMAGPDSETVVRNLLAAGFRRTVSPAASGATCTCDPGPEGQHRDWCETENGWPAPSGAEAALAERIEAALIEVDEACPHGTEGNGGHPEGTCEVCDFVFEACEIIRTALAPSAGPDTTEAQ